ncbi:MAG: hypothetical protein ABI024_10380 [Vicinamibacterales bacterium]
MSAFSSGGARAIFTTLLLLTVAFESAPSGAATIEITLQLHPDHRRHEARIRDAAGEAIGQYVEWFGPAPFESLIVETAPPGVLAPADRAGRIALRLHWLQPERSLLLEAKIARATARQWWGGAITMPDQALADGIAEYAQSRIVERIYDRRHQRLAYSTYETRYFGGLVPWAIRALRLDRRTAGIGRAEYRRHSDVDVGGIAPELRAARAAKVAAGLLTLERYVGWPALQRGLSLAIERYRGRSMSADEFARTISDAAERDLSWFFDPLFKSTATWDYAVTSIATEARPGSNCGNASCIRSTIVIERLGDAMFTGTAHPPSGDFESGRAIEIDVEFADGQMAQVRWDGRAASKTLTFDGPSPVTRASIDPREVLAMDLYRQNNTRSVAVADTTTRASWSVRWTIWLQDLLLTHALFY